MLIDQARLARASIRERLALRSRNSLLIHVELERQILFWPSRILPVLITYSSLQQSFVSNPDSFIEAGIRVTKSINL